MSHILDSLNPAQRKAASHIDGALLILAGAGSGKTKTLTTRLAYLINDVGIPPNAILTLTFTNKAASEMQTRALGLLGANTNYPPPLLCTFHKFGLLFLRFNINRIGRKENFVLIDSDDQKRLIKKLDLELPTPLVLNYISSQKNVIITSKQAIQYAKTPYQKTLANAYENYTDTLQKNNMVDFDDLLLLSYQILESNEELADLTSQTYQYIMVDEYQDTNFLQVELLKKLCSTHQNLCVVGDDDQSIYSWRGADVRHILEFTKTFSGAKMIKLETNYRSKAPILAAANALITHNSQRLGKQLESIKGDGERVGLLRVFDETKEADMLSKEIKTLLNNDVKPTEIAILFRLNALSRSIEEGLNRARIPYKLIGATRFYERMEIKDILAYFRLVINHNDDFSLSRIINVPRRGIGKVAEAKIFESARASSVYEHFTKLESILLPNQYDALKELFLLLEDLAFALKEGALVFLDMFEKRVNILGEGKNKQDNIDREANIQEFYGFFRDYIAQHPNSSLEDFLNDLSLHSDLDAPIEDRVCCMSVHSSKGLEFDYVFIVGLEEGFFPLTRDDSDIQEERRLCYVAFTRAKERLCIVSANSRFYKGNRTMLEPSRFLYEANILSRPAISKSSKFNTSNLMFSSDNACDMDSVDLDNADNTDNELDSSLIKTGDSVEHKIFGKGIVKEVSNDRLKINFGGNVRLILKDFVTKI